MIALFSLSQVSARATPVHDVAKYQEFQCFELGLESADPLEDTDSLVSVPMASLSADADDTPPHAERSDAPGGGMDTPVAGEAQLRDIPHQATPVWLHAITYAADATRHIAPDGGGALDVADATAPTDQEERAAICLRDAPHTVLADPTVRLDASETALDADDIGMRDSAQALAQLWPPASGVAGPSLGPSGEIAPTTTELSADDLSASSVVHVPIAVLGKPNSTSPIWPLAMPARAHLSVASISAQDVAALWQNFADFPQPEIDLAQAISPAVAEALSAATAGGDMPSPVPPDEMPQKGGWAEQLAPRAESFFLDAVLSVQQDPAVQKLATAPLRADVMAALQRLAAVVFPAQPVPAGIDDVAVQVVTHADHIELVLMSERPEIVALLRKFSGELVRDLAALGFASVSLDFRDGPHTRDQPQKGAVPRHAAGTYQAPEREISTPFAAVGPALGSGVDMRV